MLRRMLVALVAMIPLLAGAPSVAAAPAPDLRTIKRLGKDFRVAHQTTRGKGVTVAVLGSGVDPKVRTLSGKVKKGRDFVKMGRPKKTTGTLIASLIAGSGPDHKALGVRGFSPGVKILPVRVHPETEDAPRSRVIDWYDTAGSDEIVAKGIRYAVDKGATVIYSVLPAGGEQVDKAIKHAVEKDAVVVTPLTDGDDDGSADAPQGNPGVITVAGINEGGTRLTGKIKSIKSGTVLVAAPGFKQFASGPGNRLWLIQSTVASGAWVASAAALIKSEYPELSPGRVAQAMAMSARGKKKGGYNTSVGFGMVNPAGALTEAKKLAKLEDVAEPGRDVVDPKAHFGGGKPEQISAVQFDMTKLAGFGGVAAAGLVLLLAALVRLARRRGARSA